MKLSAIHWNRLDQTGKAAIFSASRLRFKIGVRRNRKGAASVELVMASAVAIPIAGGLLFLGFQICRYVFVALSGLLSMPFV
jgi:hypothetical protein